MGRFLFSKFWIFIKLFVYLFKVFPNFIKSFMWSIFSPFRGFFSVFIRYLIFSSQVNTFGKNTYIGSGVVLKCCNKISVGQNLSIHDGCYIDASGSLTIGDEVSIAHHTSILTFNHTWVDTSQPIKYNPVELSSVVIEDDVWIGCGVRIMPGVTIGKRSVIAAGSVVTKDVAAGTMVAGVPARKIKDIVG